MKGIFSPFLLLHVNIKVSHGQKIRNHQPHTKELPKITSLFDAVPALQAHPFATIILP